MIRSFQDGRTGRLFHRERVKGLSMDVQRAAMRKLQMIDAAEALDDLRVPPGNRLEKLKGDHKDQYSIRVNDQWRICFSWVRGNADHVQLIDYH